jgi:uncharacterized Zn-finger protein
VIESCLGAKVSFKSLFQGYWLTRIILVVWIVSSGFLLFSLNQIDGIIHGTMYNYGLQFNNAWAQPYWSYTRLIYVALSVPMVLSAATLLFSYPKRKNDKKQVHDRTESSTRILISCPFCKKVFTKPLVVLDFADGKGKLMNVCPYCSKSFAGAENGKDFAALVDLDTKVVQ